jgi:aspartyl-tRNA(Asn)/glutamyl-tRNA(Gln) amidotransferase subunit B
LLEIVSEPDMRTPEDAFAYLTALKEMLIAGGVSDCDMEKGQLRCDANVSVRPVGQVKFGEKVELKNLNSISGVKRAVAYEIQRQIATVTKGGLIHQETRRWDDDAGVTSVMRTKESAHDYRYFPEPDLMPVTVNAAMVAEIRQLLPELPEAKRQRLVAAYGLPEYDAGVLVADFAVAEYFEKAAASAKNPKAVANWIMTELLPKFAENRITPGQLAELVGLVEEGKISGKQAKEVFGAMFATGQAAGVIVKEQGLAQVSDAGALAALADEAIAKNPKSVADFQAGNEGAINFLKGQVMKLSQGKANPQLVGEILLRKLRQ